MASSAGNSGSGLGLLAGEREVLAEVGALVVRVASTDLSAVTREELAKIVTELAAESERLSTVAGRFMELGERTACSYTKGERTMIGLVNAEARLSRARAASMRRAGRALYRFPNFHKALMAGKITMAHIDLMSKWARKANSDQVRDAEPALAAVAVLSTPEEFEDALRTWVAIAEPDEHLDDFLRAQARRHLHLQPDLFSNVHVTGVLDPLLGEQVMNTVLDNAKRLQADNRDLSIAQANHDALVQLILDPDSEGTVRPNLEILASDDDADGTSDPTAHAWVPVPGDQGFSAVHYPRTAGGNLIPPAIVRGLVPNGRVRRHRVTPSGCLADDKPAGRHFSTLQRRMIRLRDTRCQHLGCRKPARACEYDHVIAWSARGPTLVANGQLLCPFHHHWKHRHDPGGPPTKLFRDSPLE
ncbi:MAG: DUF222 domain-containing protein [Acidimicrobiales bacterium]|nr:DUF222 domain-containing protein [Acidimicrobiales bacterium]